MDPLQEESLLFNTLASYEANSPEYTFFSWYHYTKKRIPEAIIFSTKVGHDITHGIIVFPNSKYTFDISSETLEVKKM